ncbi:TPA: molecular chaperone [Providencia rettgeri]
MTLFRYALTSLLFVSATSVAGIAIDSTRVIFQASNNKTGVSVGIASSSNSQTPYLIKAQVLKTPSGVQTDVPFLVTPSLFRLEPGNTNQVRIMKKNMALPQDKESVFYLRAIATPSGEKNNGQQDNNIGGTIQISTANIIKLFYRPAGLKMEPQQAMQSLQFSADGNGLKVTNASPYYVTLNSLTVGGRKVPMSVSAGNTMISPMSSNVYPGAPHQGSVEWEAINDYGGTEVFHGQIR